MTEISCQGSDPDPLLTSQLEQHLTSRIGRPVHAFQQVDSTMDIAHELAAGDASEGTMVWAAHQTRGRGRLGRVWQSPPGGAYFSLILRPQRPASEVPQLSLVTGLSAAEAIHELTHLTPSIRWPNDVLIHGRKVCGILVEAARDAAVIGVGINVSTDPSDLPEAATSLSAAGPEDPDPYQVTGALCRRLQSWYDVWVREGFAPIRTALRPFLNLGSLVRLTTASEQAEGQIANLDEQGRLVVRFDSGVLRAFDAGEVTLLR
jgi:BirA family biotin operon repressor/biotin-[acetyl-CoA-carboxylase] ligase